MRLFLFCLGLLVLSSSTGCIAFEVPAMVLENLGPIPLGGLVPDPEQPMYQRILFGTRMIDTYPDAEDERQFKKLCNIPPNPQ